MKALASTIIGLLGAAALGLNASAASPAAWSAPAEPFRIADNLYYVGTAGISSFLITTPKGHILVDGAMPDSAPLIEAGIAKLGFKPGDVKILLNSHAHFDHAAGLAQLKHDTGAVLAASGPDRAALESGTYPGSEEVEAFRFAPVKVDRLLEDGDTVTLGGVTLTAHLTPGHSAGCTTWTFPVLVAGKNRQAMIYCSTSVAANRLVSKTRGPQYPGIAADYAKSFARLKTLRAEVFLAPHAEQFQLSEKRARLAAGDAEAFVDPGELPAVVAASEQAYKTQLARQQDAAK